MEQNKFQPSIIPNTRPHFLQYLPSTVILLNNLTGTEPKVSIISTFGIDNKMPITRTLTVSARNDIFEKKVLISN